MDSTASLLFVIRSSQDALNRMTEQLDSTPVGHRSLPALLASIVKEADVLSAALSKLATRDFEKLPDEQPQPSAPPPQTDLLEQGVRMME